ncbi:GNAT family N-acetyltransferase [Bradyrhizobium sp. AZCC 1721]|uniref:GNAT family N-acetyltransferase n=1 Tax=Bradyrhizobium sp. AZCC 1721 TaxID=3117016 RepID=UPI002FEEDCEE
MTFVVVGATGSVGRVVAGALETLGHQVRPVARSLGMPFERREKLNEAFSGAHGDATVALPFEGMCQTGLCKGKGLKEDCPRARVTVAQNLHGSTQMQPVLTTGRLVLRPLAAEDGPQIAHVFEGAGVRRYLFDNEPVSPEMLREIVEDNLRRRKSGFGLWLICRGEGVIGCIGLHRASPQAVEIFPAFEGRIETIIALKEDAWGAGYAKESLEAVLAYTSDVLKQRRIVALVDVPNRASHALFRRCGFREIGAGQGPLYRAIAYERTT